MGAYRDVAAERIHDRRDRIVAGTSATTEREQLRREEAELLTQLERNRLDMEEKGVKRITLSALVDIPNAAPCLMRWDDMDGDGDIRKCSRCKKKVANVALLDSEDRSEFPAADPAAPFHRRTDGTIIFGECGAGSQSKNMNRVIAIVVAVVALAVAGAVAVVYVSPKKADVTTAVARPIADPDHSPYDAPHVDPTPAPVPIRLTTAVSVHIYDVLQTPHDHYGVDIELTAKGNAAFAYAITCNSNAHVMGQVASERMRAFIDALNKRSMSRALPLIACSKADEQSQIRVDITTAETVLPLSVRNCSHQWLADGVPLDDDARANASDAGTAVHAEVNQRYQELMHAINEKPQCKALDSWALQVRNAKH
ncbi:MAG: hypothetical protein ABI461_03800 [Polyangiaceae bacterium]